MSVNIGLVVQMLEMALDPKKRFASWEALQRPNGFEEAALFIKSRGLADNVGFGREKNKINMVFMTVNDAGKEFINSYRNS